MSWKSMMMATAVAYADPSLDAHGADALEITDEDAAAIANLVHAQIAAFRRDDERSAFALTSPALRATFRSADRFMDMVRTGYPAIYSPTEYTLGSFVVTPSGIGQVLDVIGPEDEQVKALYLLEKQRDGTWRTHGCLVIEVREAVA